MNNHYQKEDLGCAYLSPNLLAITDVHRAISSRIIQHAIDETIREAIERNLEIDINTADNIYYKISPLPVLTGTSAHGEYQTYIVVSGTEENPATLESQIYATQYLDKAILRERLKTLAKEKGVPVPVVSIPLPEKLPISE